MVFHRDGAVTAELIVQSVSIRDSRHSLELNASLWRLSWITFIFLPLTFLVGFFGMNVRTFERYPSIKWYFVGCVGLVAVQLVFWLSFKWFMPEARKPRVDGDGDGDGDSTWEVEGREYERMRSENWRPA